MERHNGRNIWYLFLGIWAVSGLAWFVNTFPPTSPTNLIIFFLLVFFSGLFLSQFVLKKFRLSVLLSTGLTIFLLLRLLDLRQPIYPALLFACLLSLELYYRKR